MPAAILATVVLAFVSDVPPDTDWMSRRAEVLELALAHQDKDGPDGGILTVDPNRRLVLWAGIPGELGCKQKVEARFEDVKSVRTDAGAGFTLEFKKGVGRKLLLLPRPHGPWFFRQYRLSQGDLNRVMSSMATADGEGDLRAGGSRGGVAGLERAELPAEVRADTRAAVNAILETLGRPPAAGEVLRETLHGSPVDVSLAQLLEAPSEYEGRAVRTVARLESLSRDGREHRLSDEGATLLVIPVPDAAKIVAARDSAWEGQEVEVTGLFHRHADPGGGPPVPTLSAWEYAGPGEGAERDDFRARVATLQALASAPATKGDLVRVLARFRGRNLHGDLSGPPPHPDAWVVKDGGQAAWVVGRAPRGKAWRLDPDSPADTRQWVEIVARPEVRNGVLHLKALHVALAAPPAGARVRTGRHIVTRATEPPVIVFALPLDGDGEEGIPPDGRFVLQFSKYMDEETFEGRVRLRYAGPPRPGDPDFGRVRLSYDEERRALVVDPGVALEPGREVECVLLPGITDLDGQLLSPRPGKSAEGAVEVLRYEVGS